MALDFTLSKSHKDSVRNTEWVSIDDSSHQIIMSYVSASAAPNLFQFHDYLSDGFISHSHLPDLKSEIDKILSEFRPNSMARKPLMDLLEMVIDGIEGEMNLYAYCD